MKAIVVAIVALLPALAMLNVEASHAPGHAVQAQIPLVSGEVRRVDKEAGRITLKHDAIPNLDMTAMTMVFRVKDPAMLDKLKSGDRVRFKADKVEGAFTVTEIAPAR